MLEAMKKFIRDEQGLTTVEYVIGAGLLVAALATVFSSMGTSLATKLGSIINSI